MDHFVCLERIPPNLQFPAEFQDRLRYDAGARRLIHRGFMSKAEFDQLWLLSDDWGYRRSLEELFRLCSPETSGEPRGFSRWLKPLLRVTGRKDQESQ
jgi:hypothetical protein